MVKDEGADAGFGGHHEAFGEFDADFFGAKEFFSFLFGLSDWCGRVGRDRGGQ